MYLTYAELKNKIMGCWAGKNIGGVLGGPDEGFRRINDISFYKQDLSGEPPANDDLDLQLIWLNACEKFGRKVNASILGEYWLTFTIPDWVEYGTGKANMRAGLRPPHSGYMENPYRNSCGCFIRSEIWACLFPGHPDEAVRFAYEDAIVDHAEEGMYGEVFCAAMESAAFVCSDKRELINIGLSYIPENCDVARAVKLAVSSYDEGVDWTEARKRIMTEVPGSFGVQSMKKRDIPTDLPCSEAGNDAANNIGLMIVGWMYGEEDFGKSLCIAVNCGEDTDCTAATLGAVIGIVAGAKNLPEKWTKPLGNKIATCCIDKTSGLHVPETVDELTDRIMHLLPVFVPQRNSFAGKMSPYSYIKWEDNGSFSVETLDEKDLFCNNDDEFIYNINGGDKPRNLSIENLLKLSPYAVKYNFPMFTVIVDYMGNPVIHKNEPKKIKLRIIDSGLGQLQPQFLNIRFYTSDNVTIEEGNFCSTPLQSLYRYEAEHTITLSCEDFISPRVEIIADIKLFGRHTNEMVKISLLAK